MIIATGDGRVELSKTSGDDTRGWGGEGAGDESASERFFVFSEGFKRELRE